MARAKVAWLVCVLVGFIWAADTVLAVEPASAPDYFPPPESAGGWRKLDDPGDIRRLAGMDPEKLAGLREWLLASDKRDFAAVVIRNGYIVLEVERGNSAKTDSRRVASCSKAICATVLAIASEESQQGRLKRKMRFGDPAFDFIPWAQPLSDPRKAKITVAQLLNHTSGICPEATGAKNDGTWEYVLGQTGDPHTERLAFDPGTACGYSTHAFHHASLVCETVTGKPYDEYAVQALFRPIGCEHWWFQAYDSQRHGRHPSHGLGMPARDMARIAYCLLRGGKWKDRQVVPEWFVAETANPTHDVKSPELRFKRDAESFSHGWELPARLTGAGGRSGEGIPGDARSKSGSGGQLVAFVPSLDLVVTRQTGGSGAWQYEEYLRLACHAVLAQDKPRGSDESRTEQRGQTATALPGQIVIDQNHPAWLKRQGGKHVFLCGPGDPEDFLYLGRRNPDGTRAGDQRQRIEKLIEHGGNCLYVQIVRSPGGDVGSDRTQNPFVDSDPSRGLDEDILRQWDEWFALLDRHNIVLYLFFYDDGARLWDTGDRVDDQERAFVEAIVRRYQHLKNLIWIVAEESEERYSHARVRAIAEVIRAADEHGHMIGNHHQSGTTFKAWQAGSALSHFAMQLTATGEQAHAGAIEARRIAAGRYQVIYSESTATPTDVDGMRDHAWSVAMGGLMPMLLKMDIATTPPETLHHCRYLQTFFEQTDFHTLQPHDKLRHGQTRYVLARPGQSYVAYGDRVTGELGLKELPAGKYAVSWLDCRSGKTASAEHSLTVAGEATFPKPAGFGDQCAAWIRPGDSEN